MNRIEVSNTIHLAPITKTDVHDLVLQANNEAVSRNLCEMPFPYQLSDAVDWVKHVKNNRKTHGFWSNYAIYTAEGELIGGIGRHVRYGTNSHKDEIGYWLGQTWWGKGIMTEVVRTYCEYLFSQQNLVRIEAVVFAHNKPSATVLKNCEFEYEGRLKKAYKINGELIDCCMPCWHNFYLYTHG